MRRPMLFLLAFLFTTAAHAHAVVTPREAPADSYARLAISITHGCDGSPTKVVRVRIPRDVVMARPQPKAGWTLTINKEKLPAPVEGPHGMTLSERVTEIVWTGSLDAEHFDDFVMNVRLPDKPGEMLPFATKQECEKGELNWNEVGAPGHEHHVDSPAPMLKLTPKRQQHAH